MLPEEKKPEEKEGKSKEKSVDETVKMSPDEIAEIIKNQQADNEYKSDGK